MGPFDSLKYFLYKTITEENFNDEALEVFSRLDDYDVFTSIKQWCFHEDFVLSRLSKMIIERKLFGIELQDKPFSEKKINKLKSQLKEAFDIPEEYIDYFIFLDTASNQAYNVEKPIKILNKKGKVKDIVKASDHLNLKSLSKPVVKYYCCYPKNF